MKYSANHRSSCCAFFRRSALFQTLIIALTMPGLSIWTVPLKANPSGGMVMQGNVNIGSGAGGNLQIRQNSNRAIIDWNSFSIAQGELTQFRQPGANAAVLNRVTGGDPSAIHGALRANGNVFVINPNGILVGQSGTIDVHGLVLSTLDVDNGEFLAGGDMTFRGAGEGVTNFGRINAIGGDVFLIGQTVRNSGSITATGTVGMGAGTEVLLTANETATGERMFVRSGQGSGGTGVLNDGTIQGAAVELKAHGNVYALAINNKGSVRATGATNSGGKVFLRGVGGEVHNSGSIRASGPSGRSGRVLIEAAYAKVDGRIEAGGVERGGDIVVEAEEIEIGSNAVVDASGPVGGSVRIGGGVQGQDESIANAERVTVEEGAFISATGTSAAGDAGSVVLWSEGTTDFRGEINAEAHGSGDGGFVEVSGKEILYFDGVVSTLSAGGGNGTLLLDPTDVEINSALTVGSSLVTASSLTTALANGNVVISTNSADADAGDIFINEAVLYDETNNLSFLATRHIHTNASVQNAGAGAVNLVAGWDEATGVAGTTDATGNPNADDADIAAIVSGGAFGLDNGSGAGSVFVGDGNQTAGIAVGSLGGTTTVAASGLSVTGSTAADDSFAQLGYRPTDGDAVTGAIDLNLRGGGLALTGGDDVDDSYALVGHGGTGAGSAGTTIDASISISFADGEEGDVDLMAGSTTGRGNFAQIGHGGNNWTGTKSGFVTIDGANNVSLSGGRQDGYAQIGHGGSKNAGGTYGSEAASGDISILDTVGSVTVAGGTGGENGYAQIGHGGVAMRGELSGTVLVHAGTGGVAVTGGGGNRSAARIGNSGYNHDRATSGDVTVLAQGTNAATDGIVLQGGTGTAAGAGIGSGGYLVDAAISGNTTVDVTAGDLSLTGGSGGRAYAHIGLGNEGNGGASSDMVGDVSVMVNEGNLELIGGSGTASAAQIGNGGSDVLGDFSGSISVDSAGGIDMQGGAGTGAYALIGQGGYMTAGDPASMSGNVTVTASGTDPGASGITLAGGSGTFGFAQIGHSAASSRGGIIHPDTPMDGDIVVEVAAGGLSLQAGTVDQFSHAMIGHGGRDANGDKTGAISVTVQEGDVNLTAGVGGNYNSAQIGHGGFGQAFVGDYTGNISLAALDGGLSLAGGETFGSTARVGHGGLGGTEGLSGTFTGDVTVATSDGISLAAGNSNSNTYAQIGHGGVNSNADLNGDIYLNVDPATDTPSGGGPISLTGGDSTRTFAQVGHGGMESSGNTSGTIVGFTTGTLSLQGGTGTDSYAIFGHGGRNHSGNHGVDGDIIVAIALDGVNVFGGSGTRSFAQVGHGGNNSNGTMTSDVMVNFNPVTGTQLGGGEIAVRGGSGSEAHAQIGLGGSLNGTLTGSTVVYGDMVGVKVGGGGSAAARIGAGGGVNKSGAINGSTTVVATDGGVTIDSIGGGGNAYTQIGAGGLGGSGAIAGTDPVSTTVTASGAVQVLGGGNNNASAMIGAGGAGRDGTRADAGVSVEGTSVEVVAGGGGGAFAMIGSGGGQTSAGNSVSSNISGDVSVTAATGEITVESGNSGTRAFAQIGHGGLRQSGSLSGNLNISAAADIQIQSGSAGETYTQIGHGGRLSSGDRSGDVTVDADGAVDLLGGSGDDTYAQIGHGGTAATGDKSGAVTVTVTDSVNLLAGEGARAVVQLGHGGYDADGAHSGDIEVDAVEFIDLTSGVGLHASAQIGHGGRLENTGDNGGDILLTTSSATGGIHMDSTGSTSVGTNTASYTHIGHGGYSSSAAQSGDITIESAGDITLTGGARDLNYKLIGHGGQSSSVSASGAVNVTAAGDIDLVGGTNDYTFAQVGHGGASSSGNKSATAVGGGAADGINVTSTGGTIRVYGGDQGGNGSDGRYGYAQIGMGGLNSGGPFTGDVTVSAATGIDISGGGRSHDYARIGHGGDRTSLATSTRTGDIFVSTTTGDISLAGGANHEFTSAAIGHGGFRLRGSGTGDIEVRAEAGRVILTSGGGDDANFSGTTTTGEHSYSSAQIGHGGSGIDTATLTGDILVVGADGVEIDSSGDGDRAFTQIGHGGWETVGDKTGDISVESGGDLLVQGGEVDGGYALLGHGGFAADGFIDGSITVDVIGNLGLSGGDAGEHNFAQIGHSLHGAVGGWGGIVESGGMIVSEGEFFDDTDLWEVRPEGYFPVGWTGTTPPQSFLDNGFTNSRGGYFIELPDGNGGAPTSTSRYAHYTFTTTTGGSYRFTPRWTGFNGNSDSIYFDIVEEKDGTGVNDGGIADWYLATNSTGGQGVFNWDTANARYEESGIANPATDQMVWELAPDTTYTLRVNPREDGVAFDSWMLALEGAAPTGDGPGVTFANASGISGSSDIDVTVGGDISLDAGAGNDAHAAIGHGGSSFYGVNDNLQYGSAADGADIRVESGGNVLLDGGQTTNAAAARSYAAIGHHGIDAGFDAYGNIEVHAGAGTVELRAGDVENASAQIGHLSGGYSLEATRTLSGDICVVGFDGVTLTSASADARAHSQIGHGGDGLAGDFDGDVTVVAPDGSVTLTGGGSADGGNYAQIGHGGIDADGTLSGNLWVVAGNGDTTLTGGAADQSYAMIGNGDGAKTSLGQREGGVHLYSTGQLAGTNGTGAGSEVYIFHQNDNGLQPGDYLGGDGYQKVALGGISLPGSSTVDESTMINSSIVSGGVLTIFDTSATDYLINPGDQFVDTALDHFIVTGGNIVYENSYQNAGTGDVTLVAGWDGSNVGSMAGGFFFEDGDYCRPAFQEPTFEVDFNNCDTFGNDGKTVTIGSSGQTDAVLVGSRGGTTTVAGYGLTLNGGSGAGAATQLGFRGDGSGPITGAIDVRLKEGGLTLNAGSGEGAYTQIGHGGVDGLDNVVGSPVSVSFCEPGDVALNGGTGAGSYAQIGHGGITSNADLGGDLSVLGAGAITLDGGTGDGSYSQIGNGGLGSRGVKNGDITVAGQSLAMNSGAINAYTQIGSGGLMTRGDIQSAIDVETTVGGVSLEAGAADNSYSLIGSGGAIADGQFVGDIDVTSADTVDVIGGGSPGDGVQGVRNFAQIGHSVQGFFLETIDGIFFIQGEDFTSRDPNSWELVPDELPNGDPASGLFSNALGDGYLLFPNSTGASGDPRDRPAATFAIEIDTTGSYRLFPRWTGYDGGSDSIYLFIEEEEDGLGGTVGDWYMFDGDGGGNSDFGNIGWSTLGEVESTVSGGGTNQAAVWDLTAGDTIHVSVTAREPGVALDAFVLQLASMVAPSGDGPATESIEGGVGGAIGNVTVNAVNDITLEAGINDDSYAAIGHGGTDTVSTGNQATFGDVATAADISVESTAGDIRLSGGQFEGDAADASRRYAVIGHHGADALFEAHGTVDVNAAGVVELNGGIGEKSQAQIGHSLANSSPSQVEMDGNVVVNAGSDISLNGGAALSGGAGGYAQIGHGGVNLIGEIGGDISVASTAGILVGGGDGSDAYSQIGHGGFGTVGAKSGEMTVSGGTVDVLAGDGLRSFARVGHGGFGGSGVVTGGIELESTVGDVFLSGGGQMFSSVQVGHGGANSGTSVVDERIGVSSVGDVVVQGGAGLQSSAMIGHGGVNVVSAGGLSGEVEVSATGSVSVLGGVGNVSYAQVGHGGGSADGPMDGAIAVTAGENVEIVANNGGNASYAKIGHGDDFSGPLAALGGTGTRSGDIAVGAGTDITLNDGMIGHVNAASPAIASSGSTQIGVSRVDPTDPGGGNLSADADSEFSGIDELRFYLPRRDNNQIQGGAMLNGVLYEGVYDPWEPQGADEFTINHVDAEGNVTFPNEHGNIFGTGPQPPVPDGFAFYYDTLELVDPPVVVEPGGGLNGDGSSGGGSDADGATGGGSSDLLPEFLRSLFPDDQLNDDDQREHEEDYTAWYPFFIYYEGYEQYGPKGESVFKLDKIEGLESLEGENVPETPLFDENVLGNQ